jgi:hypothetical protein
LKGFEISPFDTGRINKKLTKKLRPAKVLRDAYSKYGILYLF